MSSHLGLSSNWISFRTDLIVPFYVAVQVVTNRREVTNVVTHPESPRMMTFKSTFFLEVIFPQLQKDKEQKVQRSALTEQLSSNLIVASQGITPTFWLFKDNTISLNVNMFLCRQDHWQTLLHTFASRVSWDWTNQIWIPFIPVMCFLSCWESHEEHIILWLSHTPQEVTS